MAFDYTDHKAWQGAFNPNGKYGPGLGTHGVTEEELLDMGILFGQGPTGFVDRETRQPIDPNTIPLPARAQIPALMNKLGGYATQVGQYAKQTGQDIAETAGNIWDRIDSEYQRDPDKFNQAVKRFGRSVFEEQNTGVQWGPPGAKVTDWGKHFDAATDVYDPDSQYNMEKRAAQRAEQKDIIALGMAQVESQIQQITLGKSELELKQLLDKVENASYHELPAELKPVYNSLVTQGNTPEQAMKIIGETLRKRYDAKTQEIEAGIDKTQADTKAQQIKNAIAESNKANGNPDSLNKIDDGTIRGIWQAEYDNAPGTPEQKAKQAWDKVRPILENREDLRTETKQAENKKTRVEASLKEFNLTTGDPNTVLAKDTEALSLWNRTFQKAQGEPEDKSLEAWSAVDTLMKLREKNEGMIDLSSSKVTEYDKKILAAIQRLRVEHPEKYKNKTDHQMYGDAQAFMERRDIDIDLTKTLNKLEAEVLSGQRTALTQTYNEFRARLGTYEKARDVLKEIPDEIWSLKKPFWEIYDEAKSLWTGERAKWRGDVENLKKLTTEMAFQFIAQTKGAISDREMDLFKSAVISWDGTKESNLKYVNYLIGKAQSKIDQIKKLDVKAKDPNRKGKRLSVEEIEAAGNPDNGIIAPDIEPLLQAREGQQPRQGTGSETGTGNRFVIDKDVIAAFDANPTLPRWEMLYDAYKDKNPANMPPKPAK